MLLARSDYSSQSAGKSFYSDNLETHVPGCLAIVLGVNIEELSQNTIFKRCYSRSVHFFSKKKRYLINEQITLSWASYIVSF